MKNKILLTSGVLFVLALPAFALPLVPCGSEFVPCTPCHLWLLANRIISFLLFQLATPILVVALLVGGFVWLTSSGNPAQIEKGKKILTSSVLGIFIAFGAWLIVNSIIQTLAEGKAIINWNEMEACPAPIVTPPPTGGPSDGGGIKPPTGTFQTEDEARAFFKKLGFTDADLKPPCPAGQTKGCLNLVGLPKSVAQALATIKLNGGNFRISAGTEGGHATHGIGKPAVDIVPKGTPTKQDFANLRQKAFPFSKSARCEAEGGAEIKDCGPQTNHVHLDLP